MEEHHAPRAGAGEGAIHRTGVFRKLSAASTWQKSDPLESEGNKRKTHNRQVTPLAHEMRQDDEEESKAYVIFNPLNSVLSPSLRHHGFLDPSLANLRALVQQGIPTSTPTHSGRS